MEVIFLVIFIGQLVSGLNCAKQNDCHSVSDNPNYVDCVNNQCVCLTNLGFTGNATQSYPCTCAPGNDVISKNGNKYCLNVPLATQSQVNAILGDKLVAAVLEVYSSLVYPIPLFILNGSKSLNFFAPNVRGRIDPFGIFDAHTLVEYFFAAAVNPGIGVVSVNVIQTATNLTGTNPVVYIRVDLLFGVLLPGGSLFPVENLTQTGKFTFDPNNQTIIAADVILHNLGFATDAGIKDRVAFVTAFCTQYFATCNLTTDPNGYYGTPENCFNTLFDPTKVRQTTWNGDTNVTYDQAAGNTQVCRQVHLNIAFNGNRFVHCPHAGSTGGGQCTDEAGIFGPLDGPYMNNYYSAAQQGF